ncbi:MAG: SDR family oxidoreductase [Gammaproteobacteria bacterium]|nr:SDR family oxidoreductase [Gammaproteobacteria bacterium]
MQQKMLIFGFGYAAGVLAKYLAAIGFHIAGTSRSKQGFVQYNDISCELIDFKQPEVEKKLRVATHILVSTPPIKALGDPVLASFIDLIRKYRHQFQWLGYLSSTAVYGDHKGGWVDESSTSICLGQRALLRQNAEKAWISVAQKYQLPLHVFRIAGIYGPQRNALTRILQGNSPLIYKENHFFSRIHVEDIVAVLLASIRNPNPISIYNVADDEPTPSYEVDEYACSLLDIPVPESVRFELAVLSPMVKEFYTHHRRVSNAKIKEELFVQLHYPTYREGLDALYQRGDYSR